VAFLIQPTVAGVIDLLKEDSELAWADFLAGLAEVNSDTRYLREANGCLKAKETEQRS